MHIRKNIDLNVLPIVLLSYCDALSAPSAQFTTHPVLNESVNSTSTYTCFLGYAPNAIEGAPTITCNPNTISAGSWTINNGTCESMYGVQCT